VRFTGDATVTEGADAVGVCAGLSLQAARKSEVVSKAGRRRFVENRIIGSPKIVARQNALARIVAVRCISNHAERWPPAPTKSLPRHCDNPTVTIL
jgi:hypothetical protein